MNDYSEWVVFLVDDDVDSIIVMNEIFGAYNIDLRVARDGNECLALLDEIQPTIIVLDLAMPDLDGWETLSALRADPRSAHIPVVAVTAYHSVSVAQDARAAGFDAYFAKPIGLDFVEELRALM